MIPRRNAVGDRRVPRVWLFSRPGKAGSSTARPDLAAGSPSGGPSKRPLLGWGFSSKLTDQTGCPGSGAFPDPGKYAARIAIALVVVIALLIVLSTIHPWGNLRANAPNVLLEGTTVPANVRQVLEKKCADCHSENTHWPAYSRVAPASWLIERDVHDGRSHMNLSHWQRYSLEDQAALLNRIAAEVRTGQMPPKRYLALHPQGRLSPEEHQLIYDWAKAERKQIRKQLATK